MKNCRMKYILVLAMMVIHHLCLAVITIKSLRCEYLPGSAWHRHNQPAPELDHHRKPERGDADCLSNPGGKLPGTIE